MLLNVSQKYRQCVVGSLSGIKAVCFKGISEYRQCVEGGLSGI